jgi:hypothetical protein
MLKLRSTFKFFMVNNSSASMKTARLLSLDSRYRLVLVFYLTAGKTHEPQAENEAIHQKRL